MIINTKFPLEASIPDAKEYITYEIANKAEENKELFVDSLSNEHIEIHSTMETFPYRDNFNKELTNFVNGNTESCSIKLKTEYMTKNNTLYRMQYAILTNIQPLNGEVC